MRKIYKTGGFPPLHTCRMSENKFVYQNFITLFLTTCLGVSKPNFDLEQRIFYLK